MNTSINKHIYKYMYIYLYRYNYMHIYIYIHTYICNGKLTYLFFMNFFKQVPFNLRYPKIQDISVALMIHHFYINEIVNKKNYS